MTMTTNAEIKVGTQGFYYSSLLESWPVHAKVIYMSKSGHRVLIKETDGAKWEHTLTRREDGTYRRLGMNKGYRFVPSP